MQAASCRRGERVKAISNCNFDDVDGVYVDAILFVNSQGKFRELFIWKVDGSPLISFPSDKDGLKRVCIIVK
ncbi:DUF6984 family protein [Halomonas sp. DP4Y7-2]|uniref:DUF6984 family protein n=1 Tax=unclassified Halomonas TaxID=2609666 RepID=UPI0039658A8C